MGKEIGEYAEALAAHMDAQRSEMRGRMEVRSTYYALQRAKEAMRAAEIAMLEEIERDYQKK